MFFLGFSINTFTLLALILAIGLVVDDAIVVLENAYRHQEELVEDPVAAARDGTREIAFAVIATTVSLVAVFSPLAFLQGTTGRLFNEFGVALAGAVIVSSFVALSFTPMLCARILRVPKSHGPVFQTFERGFEGLSTGYSTALGWALRHRWIIIGGAVGALVVAVVTFRALEREFVPDEDRGWFVSFIQAPEGSTVEFTDQYQRRVEAILAKTDDIDLYFSIVGGFVPVNQGLVFSMLTDWSERDRSTQDVIGELFPQYFGIPGVQAFAPVLRHSGGSGVRLRSLTHWGLREARSVRGATPELRLADRRHGKIPGAGGPDPRVD